MKIVSVVGARPQFIKAAVLSKALRAQWEEVLVHTGQHYDDLMSDVFFRELGLPAPDTNLGVGSASHAVQTARMLEGLEVVYEREKPDLVIVYGDTNSTLAGALAAAKLGIPIAHVEAGFRSYERDLPEEVNRVLTDHIAAYLFCATAGAVGCLAREGITTNVQFTGDLMYDSLLAALPHATFIEADVLGRLGLIAGAPMPPDSSGGAVQPSETAQASSLSPGGEGWGEGSSHRTAGAPNRMAPPASMPPDSSEGAVQPFETPQASSLSPGGEGWGEGGSHRTGGAPNRMAPPASMPRPSGRGALKPYYLATVHRAATTDDPSALASVLEAFGRLDLPVVLPLHPRTATAMASAGLEAPPNVRAMAPVGYFEMLALERNARAILTDSGGVRREAYWLSVPCVTLRAQSEWPETVESGWDTLAGTDADAIVRAAQRPRPDASPPPLFGDGQAATKIVEVLRNDPPYRRG